MGDLEEELDLARSELEELQVKYDAALDEQDRKVAELEEECEERIAKAEEDARQNMEELQADCDQKVDDLTEKLDMLRRAMTGDTCGWIEKKDGKGDTVYENTETGESSYEKPEALTFAQTIQKVDGAAADKSNLHKLEQKAKDNEAKKREADVKYNESRAETQNLRGLNNAWKSSAEVIYYSFLKYEEEINKMTNSMVQRSDYVAEKTDSIVRAREGVDLTISKVAEIQLTLEQREDEIKRLLGTIGKQRKMVERAEAEIALLRTSVVAQIEKVASPLRDELAASYTLIMEEKAGRELDRQQLADLWPDGWLMPSLLQKYRTLSPEEREQKRQAALEADAERKLKLEIRQKVLDATKWTQGFDEYGRAYFVHADTDEQVWEMPEAMSYTPPPGRDEFGNKVTTPLPRASQATMKPISKPRPSVAGEASPPFEDIESEEKLATAWETVQDEWGQTFYRNNETGEETWERPEELGEEVAVRDTPQIGMEFDPKTRATLCARVTIEWIRNAQSRRQKEEDDDDDHVLAIEGEQVDDEALMYDMKTVEDLAAGEDGWMFEPADDEDDDDDSDSDDSENEGGTTVEDENGEKKKKGPPSIPTLRSEVYKAALEEEELETKLRHTRRKVERVSKHLIDRIQEIEKAERESIVAKDTAMNDEGQAQVKNALAELEASMAAAANSFNFGAVEAPTSSPQIDGDEQEEDLKAEHEKSADQPMAPIDADTLWADLSHRRVVDAAMPRGGIEDDACHDLAIEAMWAGFADVPICEPPFDHWKGSDEEWRAAAFFARGAEVKDEEIVPSDNHVPVLVSLQQHMSHQEASSSALTTFEKARHAAIVNAEKSRAADLSMGANATAKAAKFKGDYHKAPELRKESSREHNVGSGGSVSDWIAHSDDTPLPFVEEVPVEDVLPNPTEDKARLEMQTNQLKSKMQDLLAQDAKDVGVEPPKISEFEESHPRHHRRRSKRYVPPKSKIIEQAELHVASLLPLLREADMLRAKLWETHEIEQEKIDGWVENLKERFSEHQQLAAEIRSKQVEVSSELRSCLVARVPPTPPPDFSMEGKVITLAEDMVVEYEPPPPEVAPTTTLLDVNEFRVIEAKIVSGEADGQVIKLPPLKHINIALQTSLQSLIEKRNAKITEREKRRFDHETARYEKKRAAFDAAEAEHGVRLENIRNQLRGLDIEDKVVKSNLGIVGRWLAWAEEESKLVVTRADGMYSCEMRAQAFRGKQIVEGIRGVEALSRLQDELHVSMTNRRGAIQMADSARNAIERLTLEREKADIVALARADVFRLREAILEEGRRRRWLYAEEIATAQMELRRLRDLTEAKTERSSQLALIQGIFNQLNSSLEALWTSRKEEIRAAALNAVPEFSDAGAAERVVFHEKCLAVVLQARNEGQLREKRLVSEHKGLVMMQIPLPPDQWVPQAERRRYEEENWALRSKLETSVRHLRGVASVNERRRLDAEAEVRRVMVAAVSHREASGKALSSAKETWEHSMTMLKLMMDTQRDEMAQEISRYQRALSELAREYSSVRMNLTAKAEHLALRVKDLTSWLAACRYDLSVETAKRLIGDEDRKRIIYQWRRESDALRAELIGERMHTARLEVWIAAMRQDVGNFLKEIWLRERMLELQKQTNEEELNGLRYCIWKNATGLNRVATDVNSLFLFFAQRLAGLAGSRRHYNEALRANGAAAVLAALCKSPRQDLRRLAARALGMMGWDGYMEQRLIAFEAKRSWELWLEQVIPEEEERLNKLNLSFVDRAPTAGDDEEEKFEAPEGVHWRALIVARRQWALRNARRKEGPNLANMKLLGAQKDILSVLIMLTHEADIEVVRGAALALSVAAFHESNNGSMGRMPECVDALVRLCSSLDPEVCSQAAASLANLGYGHALNQRLIGDAGGLENLLDLCCTNDVDVIESSTAALANLICLHKDNAVKLSSVGGLQVLLRLISSAIPANLLDSDQMSEIQANSAEALANLTANFGEESSAQLHTLGVAPLVLLCGSGNLQVRRHAALVLGNIAQRDEHRAAVGVRGGVEALFLLCEQTDEVTKANALWALGNLAWHPINQDRIGRYFAQLLELCLDKWLPVQTNAMVCLANALFYHDRNRSRIEELPSAVARIVSLCGGYDVSGPVQEASLRALVSLSYTDRLCLTLGKEHNIFPMLVANCTVGDKLNVQKYSLMVILNLISSDDNKRIMLDTPGAVEAVVTSAGSLDEEIVKLGETILSIMADLRAVEELRAKKGEFGVSGMLDFLKSGTVDATTKRLAIESLAEQLWLEPAKQSELASCGGIEVIMELCDNWRRQDEQMLLPALWALRNVTHENEENKDRVGSLHGVDILLEVTKNHTSAQSGHILESSLTALITMCVSHERNCRRVLKHGLDDLLDIAEGSTLSDLPSHFEDMHWDETMGVVEKQRALERRRTAVSEANKTNQSLATSLLQIVGPYNWVVCENCQQKNYGGSTCANCGHSVSFS